MTTATLPCVTMATDSKGDVGYVSSPGVIQSNSSTHATDRTLLPN